MDPVSLTFGIIGGIASIFGSLFGDDDKEQVDPNTPYEQYRMENAKKQAGAGTIEYKKQDKYYGPRRQGWEIGNPSEG